MKPLTHLDTCAVRVAILLLAFASPAWCQSVKSYSSGLFVGIGAEADGIVTNPSGRSSTTESGAGAGLELGYGFSRRWSLYGGASTASMHASAGGSYSLSHADLGARVHFRTGSNLVVPFLQAGIAGLNEGRDIASSSGTHRISTQGVGSEFAAGLEAHVTPALAITASMSWVDGKFGNFRVDDQSASGSSVSATSSRIHLGVVWFPRAE